jgi:hypothetical protein
MPEGDQVTLDQYVGREIQAGEEKLPEEGGGGTFVGLVCNSTYQFSCDVCSFVSLR